MKKDIEKLLTMIAESEQIEHNDQLSALIKIEKFQGELSEVELDEVFAASKVVYERFKRLLDSEI